MGDLVIRGNRDRSRLSYHQGGGLHCYDRPRSQRPYDHDSYGRRHECRSHDTDFTSHDRYRRDPQQCTTKEENESVTIILMDIYSKLRVEVIRASVNHPENHRRPFDKGILLQQSLEDLHSLSTWRCTSRPEPSAALGAPRRNQVPVESLWQVPQVCLLQSPLQVKPKGSTSQTHPPVTNRDHRKKSLVDLSQLCKDHGKVPLVCLNQLHRDHGKISPVELRNLKRQIRNRSHQVGQPSQSHLVQ